MASYVSRHYGGPTGLGVGTKRWPRGRDEVAGWKRGSILSRVEGGKTEGDGPSDESELIAWTRSGQLVQS